MLRRLLTLYLIFVLFGLNAQNKYWVFLTDKSGVEFNPYEYFSPHAMQRRVRNHIPICDSTDYPLNEQYVQIISKQVDSLGFRSRWMNALVVWANDAQINRLETLPFVKKTQALEYKVLVASEKVSDARTEEIDLLIDKQTRSMGGNLFEPKQIDGKGVVIAIFDGGFPSVNTHSFFKPLFVEKRILATYDFTSGNQEVYHASSHGTMVLSNIAGVLDGKKMGLATGASFLLARTEVNSEPFSEEENWLAAVEWADKNGADIINSSLGYTHHRYFPVQMDGGSLVAKAANMAFEKGILVVNAAGNEGEDANWKYIGTPADAEHTLSIGGIDPMNDLHISFSSYGPTADGRLKPNVSALGKTVVIGRNPKPKIAYGTSFASPLVAGFAACVLQLNPNYTSKQLFEEIQKSAHLYPYYDYSHGYGIPQASYFTSRAIPSPTTFKIVEESDTIKVSLLDFMQTNLFENRYLFYKISDAKGRIRVYKVLDVYQKNVLILIPEDISKDEVLSVFYKGCYQEYSKPN